MDQNTPQAIGKDVLGTFMPHPGVIPGPGGSENRWFMAQKQSKWQGAILSKKINLETAKWVKTQMQNSQYKYSMLHKNTMVGGVAVCKRESP